VGAPRNVASGFCPGGTGSTVRPAVFSADRKSTAGAERRRGGFTILEMIVVVGIVSILAGMVVQAFGGVSASLSTRSSREALVALKAVARARAVERGTTAKLIIHMTDDRAYVIQNDTVRRSINFLTEFGVTVSAGSVDSLVLCMSPKGYADLDCNSFTTAVTVGLTQGGSTRSVTILPMGQIH